MSRRSVLLASAALLGLAAAQKPSETSDEHPQLITQRCTVVDGCNDWMNFLVLDSSSHWVHQADNTELGCGDWGSGPDPDACPTKEDCARNCIMEGITDYSKNGVTTDLRSGE